MFYSNFSYFSKGALFSILVATCAQPAMAFDGLDESGPGAQSLPLSQVSTSSVELGELGVWASQEGFGPQWSYHAGSPSTSVASLRVPSPRQQRQTSMEDDDQDILHSPLVGDGGPFPYFSATEGDQFVPGTPSFQETLRAFGEGVLRDALQTEPELREQGQLPALFYLEPVREFSPFVYPPSSDDGFSA